MSTDEGIIYIDADGKGSSWGFGPSHLFKNLESFPGQLRVTPAKSSAAFEQRTARTDVVRGARHIERTSGNVRGGIDRRTNMVVGAQLSVRPTPQFGLLQQVAGWTDAQTRENRKAFAAACEVWFYDWAYGKRCVQDAERHYNFGGLMWMAYRNLIGPDAETAGYIGFDEERATRLGSRWATFVHVLDPDRLETPPDRIDNDVTPGRPRYFQGRELDEHGAMQALWYANAHPNDQGYDPTKHRRIPRETDWGRPFGFHWFKKHRSGSQRGLSSLVTAIKGETQMDQYMASQLGAAILQEMFAVYAQSEAEPEAIARMLAPIGDTGKSAFDHKLDYYGRAKIRLGEQRLVVMPPGDKLVMEAINRAAQDTTSFVNTHLRRGAMALDLNFEQYANDYSQANYSSIRAGLLDVWRGVIADRWLFGDHVPSLIYDAVIEEAVWKNRIKLGPGWPDFWEYRDAYTACVFRGPAMGWVDPQREAAAMEIRLRTKTTSRTREIDAMGEDVIETFDEIAAEQEEADARDITLDAAEAAQAAGAAAAANGSPGANEDPDDPAADPVDNRNTGD